MERILIWLLVFLFALTEFAFLGGCALHANNDLNMGVRVGENHEIVAEVKGEVDTKLTADLWAIGRWAKESVDAFVGIFLPEGLFPLALPARAPAEPAGGGE